MFEEDPHRRFVLEHAILAIESEVSGMHVNNEGRRATAILLQDVLIGCDYKVLDISRHNLE